MSQQEINTPKKYNYSDPNHKPPFPNTAYFEFPADLNEEVMRICIGKNGCNFCRITEENEIPYIYHNKETNKIVIWAPAYKAQRVMQQLSRQLEYARKIIKKNNETNNTNTK